jgi:hypothetical protein
MVKRGFIGFRGFCESADLPYELDRRKLDFLVRRRGIKIEQGLDIPAHCLFRF